MRSHESCELLSNKNDTPVIERGDFRNIFEYYLSAVGLVFEGTVPRSREFFCP
jgi:hypothetical protein